MLIIWLIVVLVLLLSLVGFFRGAPYLPTLKKQVNTIFSLAEMRKGQTLIELGCGDGRVLIEAAKLGINSVGYEINPLLFLIALLRAQKYKGKVKVIFGDYWKKEWPEADVIFVFLLNRYMKKLDSVVETYQFKPVKLVSYAFKIANKEQVVEKNGVYLYIYK